MIIIINTGLRRYQKAMIFPGVAIDDGGTGVRTCAVRPDHLPLQRVLQVDKLILIKIDITHLSRIISLFKVKRNTKNCKSTIFHAFYGCINIL